MGKEKPSKTLLFSLLSVGLLAFVGIIMETAMNITFPTLMNEFGIGTATVQWVTSGYLLVLVAVIPLSSFLNKRISTKQNFLIAAILFLVGTVICIVAPSFWILLLGRMIQGVGLGITIPLMFNIILEQAPITIQGMMMGVATFILMIAPAFGPSLGGVIVTVHGWRYIFVFVTPLLIAALLFGLFSIKKTREPQKVVFDLFGYIFMALTFICIVLAAGFAGTFGWKSPRVFVLFLLAIAAFFVFYRHFRKTAHPVVNIGVFRSLPYTFNVAAIAMIQFNALCLCILPPNFSQIVNGQPASITGVLVLPGSVISAVIMPFSGRMLDKRGAKLPIMLGTVIMVFAVLGYVLFGQSLNEWQMTLYYALWAGGVGFVCNNSITHGLRNLPESLYPDGNAMLNTLQQMGAALGTAISSTIVATSQALPDMELAQSTAVGTHHAYMLVFAIACAILICSVLSFVFRKQASACKFE